MSKKSPAQLAPFDPRLRYPVETAAQYLSISRAFLFKKIKSGDVATIRDGRRVYLPGTEIARLSAVQS